jgi:argininosuccinate lyase
LVTLEIYADMMRGITVHKDNMRQAAFEGYATATDLADYLVKKGMPFRDAHEVVALAVKQAVQKRCDLSELSLSELQIFSPTITEDVFSVLTLEGSVASRNHVGGTSPQQVLQAIVKAKKTIHS